MNSNIKTRFAPSPTGKLHIGNIIPCIVNWLYARQNNGSFLLRFDDTDLVRSKQEYKDGILRDLKWLGINWDGLFEQSGRLQRYEDIKQQLLDIGRLYPCFETQEELEIKRKLQLSSGKPPIYDRASLKLTQDQIKEKIAAGNKPHYRFLLRAERVQWQDMVRGDIKYEGHNLSDPIVIREDGTLTYMLCSVIDDIDYEITHIIRGEDHVSNTAIQIEMFNALNSKIIPKFAHLSLMKAQDEKISKRIGGFDIESLRDNLCFEPMAINSFFSMICTSHSPYACKNLQELIQEFDISKFSKSASIYIPTELERLNHKLLISLEYDEVKNRLIELGLDKIDKQFWDAVRPNLQKLHDIKTWWKILYDVDFIDGLDKEFIKIAKDNLPEGVINIETWDIWTKKLMQITNKKGKELFLPLRIAITGFASGPELKNILVLIGRDQIIKRLDRHI